MLILLIIAVFYLSLKDKWIVCSFFYIIFAVLLKNLQCCAVCLAERVSEPEYESVFQIWCEPVQYWRSYRPLADYEMVAAAMLDSGRSDFWQQILRQDPIFSLFIKFGAKICNNGRFTAKNVIFNMAAYAILDLAEYQIAGKASYVTSFSVTTSNLM